MNLGAKAFSRNCWMKDAGEEEFGVLEIEFYLPEQVGNEEFVASAVVRSKNIEKTIRSIGSDGVQAFFSLPISVKSFMDSMVDKGAEIYWLEKGDFEQRDFWRYV